MAFNLTLKSVHFHGEESSSYILLSDVEGIFFSFFVGSIPLDPSQAFIDSPKLNAVNIITSKLFQMENNGDQRLKEEVLFFQKNTVICYGMNLDWIMNYNSFLRMKYIARSEDIEHATVTVWVCGSSKAGQM